MEGENEACVSCHSAFNNDINFTRPEFIEWDIINSSGTWTISNLVIGQSRQFMKRSHREFRWGNCIIFVSGSDINCMSCHEDIKQAVMQAGIQMNNGKTTIIIQPILILVLIADPVIPLTQDNIEFTLPANPSTCQSIVQ